jgi:hypothetical protein
MNLFMSFFLRTGRAHPLLSQLNLVGKTPIIVRIGVREVASQSAHSPSDTLAKAKKTNLAVGVLLNSGLLEPYEVGI